MAGNLYDETLDALDDTPSPGATAAPKDPLYDDAVSVLRDQDAQGETRMRQSFHAAADTTPERAAESRRLALTFGVPAPVIERNFDDYAKRDQVEQPYTAMQQQTPHTAAWLQQDNNAALAKDDLASLGTLEWLITAPQRAFQQGIDQYKGDQLRYESMFRPLSQAERDQLDAFDFNAKKGGALGADGSWFRRAVVGGIEQLPLLGGAMLMGAKYGVAGAATTATVGAAVTAEAGGVGAIPGAAVGYAAGTAYGTFKAMGELAAGQAYQRYLQIRDESLQPIDPQIAKAAALGTGVINGMLGFVGLEKLVEKIPGLDKLTGSATRTAVEQALKVPTVRAALLSAVGKYAGNLGTQATIAVGMEVANILGGEIAKTASGQSFPAPKPEDVFTDLVHSGIGALHDFSLLAAVGPAFELAHGIHEASAARHNADYFAALGDAARESKTMQRAPEAVRDLLDRATDHGPIQSVYAPLDSWVSYWQSKNVDPADMARRVTGEPDALERAQESGTDLKIPTARYATTLAPTEHNAFFARELRLAPGEMNANEAEDFLKNAQKAPAAESQPPTAREQVRQQIFEKLVAAQVPADTAEHYARLMESGVGTMAESAGLDPFEVFQRYGVDVQREGIPADETPTEAAPPTTTPGGVSAIGEPVDETGRALGGYAGPERRSEQAGPPEGVEERRLPPGQQVRLDLQNPELRKAAAALEARARNAHGERKARPRSGGYKSAISPSVDNGETPKQNPEGYFNVAHEARPVATVEEGTQLPDGSPEQPRADTGGRGEGEGNGNRAESRQLPTHRLEDVGAGTDDVFARKPLEETQKRITPEVRRELKHMLDELQANPYEERQWYWLEGGPKTGNAAGGAAEVRAGHAEGELYKDIRAFSPLNKNSKTGEVAKGGKYGAVGSGNKIMDAVAHVIETGDIKNNLAEGAVRVAENRAADDWADLSPLFLPRPWAEGVTREFTDQLSDAIDQAVNESVNEGDVEGADTSFDVSEFGQGLFDALDDAILEPENQGKTDTLDTGEQQPRLPGAEDVRDQNIATPEFEAPFALTPPENKGPKGKQRTLFQSQIASGVRMTELEQMATDEEMGVAFPEGEPSHFPNGEDAVVCTNCARRIIEMNGGKGEIYGWEEGSNPSAVVANTSHENAGHDFAVIDGRYLVDAWAKNVEGSSPRAVFDLNDPTDRAEVLRLFGDPKTWVKATKNPLGSDLGFKPGHPSQLDTNSDRELLVQHNVTAANLRHAEKLGGLPAPSLAVTKASDSLTNFGEVTLLGHKDLANPQSEAKPRVFGADVYSPRYPTIHFKIPRAGEKALSELFARHKEETGQSYIDLDSLQKEGARYLEQSGAVMAEFLGSKGIDLPEPVPDESKYARPGDIDQFHTRYAFEEVIREHGLEDEYKAYAGKLFDSLEASEHIFKGFTNLGNRSYRPHTLENVVKELTRKIRGGESESNIYGVGQLRADFAPEFKSVEAIRKAKDRIVTDAQFEAVKKEVEGELFDIGNELKPYYQHDAERFGFIDTVMAVMQDGRRKGIPFALKDYGFEDVPADVQRQIATYMAKLKTLPTEYFEAKLSRPVGLSEFAAAVIPDDATPETRAILERAGLDVSTYKAKDVADRKRAVEEVARGRDDVLFQNNGERRGSIQIGQDRQIRINLFERADLSTFLHETGHFFLEVFGDLADQVSQIDPSKLTDQQRRLLSDYGTTLKELGVENRHEVTTEQHERFARMFETYLFEGKAPSLELSSTFARFRAWLLGVYRQLRNLNAPLTDDVRGVFDRMLASDRAISEAEAAGKLEPLFTDPASAGMSADEFGLYRAHVADASRRAREELDAKLLGEVRRTQEADYKAKRETVRAAVEQETQANPVYQALAGMRRGTRADGSPLVEGMVTPPMKLSRQILVERYGEEALKGLPKPFIYTREGGLDPDFVASQYGFSSGDELLQAVKSAPSMQDAIERETERRMLAQYGSLLLDGTLPEKAQLAAANDHRDQVVRAELRALWSLQRTVKPFVRAAVDQATKERDYERRWFEAEAKLRIAIAAGKKQADIDRLEQQVSELKAQARGGAATIRRAMPSATVLRDMAIERIAGTRVTDLEPALFWSASRRAAQSAIDAAARQEFDNAITAKTSELVNLALYREAERAKEDAQSRVSKIRDLAPGRPARARIEKAGETYSDQVDGILDRYDFAKASEKVLDRRASIQKFVEGLESQGLPVDLPDEVLNDARRVHYSRLTYAELVGVSDGLKQIEHLARLKNRLLKVAEKRELRATAETLTASIEEHATSKPKTAVEVRGPGKASSRNIAQFFAAHRKLGNIVREFDGFKDGGLVWEHIMRPLNEAADSEAVRNEEATVALHTIFNDAYKGQETSLYHKAFIPAINDSLTKMARLMVALNWGNEGNRDRIRSGYRWSDDQVRAILGTLDARDGKFVQAILDHIETYWPDIEAKQKRVFGVAPEKVAASPFEIGGEQLRGGYFPIKYEHQLSARAAANLEASFADGIKQAAYVQGTTQRGHTKARVAKVSEPVRLDFGVITDHIQQVIHDLTHHETLIDVGRLLAQRDVQDSIYKHYGDIAYDQIKGVIRDVAFGNQPAPGWYQTLNAIRAKTVTATLGWNAVTSLLHTLQVTRGMVRVGPGWVAKGLVRWAVSARNAEESAGWIEDQSDMMRLRWKTQQRELNEVRNQVGLDRGKVSAAIHDTLAKVGADPGAMPAIADSYFYAIRKIVQLAEIPTWIGAYEKAMADEANDHARSVALADQAVIDSMGSGYIKDLSAVQRAPMARLLTTFYDYHNSVYNQAYELVKSSENPGRKLVDATLLLLVPIAFAATVHHATSSKKEQDREKKAGVLKTTAGEGIDYALGMYVGLRELTGAFTGRDYSGPAGLSFVPTFRNLLYRLGQEGSSGGRLTRGEKTAALAKAANETGGELFGYPARQVERTATGIQALWQGKTHNPSAVFFGPQGAK